jgi:hypothetical protein
VSECRDIRPLLDSCLSGELASEQLHSVEGHLRACAACGTELERRSLVRRELAAILDPGDTSALESRVLAALERGDSGRTRKGTLVWMAAAAASLAAAVLGVRFLAPRETPSQLDDAEYHGARRVHVNCTVPGDHPPPLAADKVPARLEGYAAIAPAIEAELARGATLLEAHVCSWPRKYAHVILQRGAQRFSVLVTARAPEPPREGTSGGGKIQAREEAGLRLEAASAADHVAFVVSDLQASERSGLSGRVLPGVLRALRPRGD